MPTKSIFRILAPRPLSSRLGAFLLPRNIFPQIFSEIFSNQTKATFFCIFGAKNYGDEYFGCSGNRGGCPLLSTPIYSRTPSLHLLSSFRPLVFPFAPSCLSSWRKASETGQKGQKLYFIWWALVFSRDFARPKGTKSKDIFGRWVQDAGQAVQVLPAFWRVCWRERGGSWGYFADVSKIVLMLPLFGVFPPFCLLSCFALGVLP